MTVFLQSVIEHVGSGGTWETNDKEMILQIMEALEDNEMKYQLIFKDYGVYVIRRTKERK